MNNAIPTIRQLLDEAPQKFNDSVFIRFNRDGKIVEKHFSEVRSNSLAFCRMLRAVSEEKEHIALVAKSSYEYIVCLTGILISGNVAIPAAPEIPMGEAVELFNAADVTTVIYDGSFGLDKEEIRRYCPLIKNFIDLSSLSVFEKIYEKYSDTSEYAQLSDIYPDPEQCSLIIYTSGTTGIRKGVMLSTRALVNNVCYTAYVEDTVRDDVQMSVLPMYHIFCFVADYIAPLKNGHSVCLNGDMRDLFKNLLVFRPRTVKIVPMIAQAILSRIKALENKEKLAPKDAAAKVTGGELEWLLSGGAYLDPSLCEEFEKYGIHLRQGYGMSEAGCKITVPDHNISYASVGRVMDIIDARIENGEIQVKTPCRMLGYYKMPEETEKVFTPDGYLKTGDIGVLTDYGELFVTGRVKNLIILSNGENVSPEGIEAQYKKHPVVGEIMVYAEKDRIIAEIYPDEENTADKSKEEIFAELERITDEININALPSHTVAKVIIREEPFEKTSTGKIKRKTGRDSM